jgi:hypothetical protein
MQVTCDSKYYTESSQAAKQQGLVNPKLQTAIYILCHLSSLCACVQIFASLPSEASIARLKLQTLLEEVEYVVLFVLVDSL